MPVPTSENQNLRSLVDSSIIPFGTVPLSPAPIQRILELDQTETPHSPTYIPAYKLDSEMMRRPASAKSALSDSLQGAAVYFDEPVLSYEDFELNDLLPDECTTHSGNSEEVRQRLACEEPSWAHRTMNLLDYKVDDEEDGARGGATNEALSAADVNNTVEEPAKLILGKGYYARAYRRADGKCRLKIKLLASDPEDGDDGPEWDDEMPFRFAEAQEDELVSELGTIIRANGIVSTCDDKFDEAFTAGKLPAYLDITLDEDNAKNVQSLIHSPTKIRERDSTWGQHIGLYDGSGYGARSSSRPVTGVTETTDVPCARIPGAFTDDENEFPTIIRRLWDNTYPHGLDADFPGRVTVSDPAIPEAQEQPESHLEN